MPGSIKCAVYRQMCVISSFRREVDEIYVLLGCYAASSVHYLQTVRTDRLLQNVGDNKLPVLAA